MDQAVEYIRKSELVVSHAGIGTIILCKEYGIPILILPRRKAYGEHMNDHQLEIAKALEKKEAEHIYVVYEEDQLEESILKILKRRERPVSHSKPRENESHEGHQRIYRYGPIMTPLPLISIVILNWNGKEQLYPCIQSVKSQTYPNMEIILVDNASTDGSAEYVKTSFP